MTRIAFLSDLHIDRHRDAGRPDPAFVAEAAAADAVVIAGDVCPGTAGIEWAAARFPGIPVAYVAGNNEYRGHRSAWTLGDLGAAAARHPNVAFLENRAAAVGGVRILGCTLWTDFELLGPDRFWECADRYRERFLEAGVDMPETRPGWMHGCRRRHRRSVDWLRRALAEPWPGPTVVVTHHAPSARSCRPEWRDDPAAAAFASHLDPLIEAAGPDLWVHGHTHRDVDYVVGRTRVVSRQRKNPSEAAGEAYRPLVVEFPAPPGGTARPKS